MKVILIGDVVGKPGRRALLANLKQLKVQHEAEFVVANVENAAEGAGVAGARTPYPRSPLGRLARPAPGGVTPVPAAVASVPLRYG